MTTPSTFPGPVPSAGRVVLYTFRNPQNGDLVDRPATVIRATGTTCQLAVAVDGPLDLALLNANERDAQNPRATVWRTAVPETKGGGPEANTWRWPTRAPPA